MYDVNITSRVTYNLFVERSTAVCVPVVVATFPRQFGSEGGEHVVKGPRQDDVVVAVQEENNDSGGESDS